MDVVALFCIGALGYGLFREGVPEPGLLPFFAEIDRCLSGSLQNSGGDDSVDPPVHRIGVSGVTFAVDRIQIDRYPRD
jgi:hypothetical protein